MCLLGVMHGLLDFLLRSAPAWTTVGSILAASALGSAGRHEDGAIALATGGCGALGDVAAHVLKVFVTEPLYRSLDRETLPILGQGPRPPGAARCGWWPLKGHRAPKLSYGMPSGHAAHAVAMFVFMLMIRPSRASLGYRATLIGLGVLALVVPASRIALGCHTPGQAFWGSLLGIGIGMGCADLVPSSLMPEQSHTTKKTE